MARKRQAPAQRLAREAARRTAAAERIGPRPQRTPSPRKPATLYDLAPPGTFYRSWARPTVPRGMTGASPLDGVVAHFGPDSGEADTMRTFLAYAEIYGPQIPVEAARHLEMLARLSGMAAEDLSEDEAVESLHCLHAQGLLLVDDDGSVWLTVPPGTPYSAPDGGWAFVEKRLAAPMEPVAALGSR